MAEEINGVPCDKMFGAISPGSARTGDSPPSGFPPRTSGARAPPASRPFTTGTGSAPITNTCRSSDTAPTTRRSAMVMARRGGDRRRCPNIELRRVSSTASADIDVRGVLGIDPDVRKGFSNVEVSSAGVDANCDDEQKGRAGCGLNQVLGRLRTAVEPDRGRRFPLVLTAPSRWPARGARHPSRWPPIRRSPLIGQPRPWPSDRYATSGSVRVGTRCGNMFACFRTPVREGPSDTSPAQKERPWRFWPFRTGMGLSGRCEQLQGDVVWVSERQARTIGRVD